MMSLRYGDYITSYDRLYNQKLREGINKVSNGVVYVQKSKTQSGYMFYSGNDARMKLKKVL
jgi:hypothetical protein